MDSSTKGKLKHRYSRNFQNECLYKVPQSDRRSAHFAMQHTQCVEAKREAGHLKHIWVDTDHKYRRRCTAAGSAGYLLPQRG